MKPNKTFIIRHKETKEVWQAASGKSSWKQAGHAKIAWSRGNYVNKYFDEQDTYEIVEFKVDAYVLLEECAKIFEECLQRELFIKHFDLLDETDKLLDKIKANS